MDYDGCVYRIRELYGCKEGQANVGLEVDPAQQARIIREVEETDENLKGRKISGIADPSIFDRSGKGAWRISWLDRRCLGIRGITTGLPGKCSTITEWHLMRTVFRYSMYLIPARGLYDHSSASV